MADLLKMQGQIFHLPARLKLSIVLIDIEPFGHDSPCIARIGIGAEKDGGAFPAAGIHCRLYVDAHR